MLLLLPSPNLKTKQNYTHHTTPPAPPSCLEPLQHHPLSVSDQTILNSNMRHLLSPIITMPIYSSSSSSSSTSPSPSPSPSSIHTRPRKPSSSSSSPNSNCNSLLCKHSPSATLDILILILVLFSGTFLLTSYFAYIFQSLSLLLPLSLSSFQDSPFPYIFGFVFVFVATFLSVEICCGYRSRKCDKLGCKGLKKALEFDLQLQTEECLRSSLESKDAIDKLPWKGGTEGNPDYECLRSELRKMAPPNGRAVLLFRARCGCPVAKLEGWGPKRSRRHKKGLALNGGGGGADHR